MRARPNTSTLVAGLVAGSIGLATPPAAAAQSAPLRPDSAPHFALFGGTAASESTGPENGLELGASGDFRWHPVPVPLRLSVSFSQNDWGGATLRGGKASLDLVMKPFARHFGIQPYFLGGVGVATRASYTYWGAPYTGPYTPTGQPGFLTHERQSWAFGSVGAGLDIGHAFIQLRAENPIASQGPFVVPLNFGFRFWD